MIHFLKNRKSKEDDIYWDVVYPHKDVNRWKHIGRLFSFDQSSYENLFSKEESFWKEFIDAKPGVKHDVTDWFGSKYKKNNKL